MPILCERLAGLRQSLRNRLEIAEERTNACWQLLDQVIDEGKVRRSTFTCLKHGASMFETGCLTIVEGVIRRSPFQVLEGGLLAGGAVPLTIELTPLVPSLAAAKKLNLI